ncbi:ATP-dependent DNA helicase Rep [Ralstonia mannitolilytica]|uniref:UvrD-helicase domain-containing protein n=1 Tax=Ralstonia mannitolilytica TaxID=105219 RepID=UPI0028F5F2F5|nr:UvrD-helicase domain-containing protein [Ralstonia mannitolilytica]CAJ0797879.1 ATP-dependent DNA helicase Rep [Ralstonia mannitolilytica]
MTQKRNECSSWTTEQRRVIEAPSTARQLIDAGPGTGKTATACARIAWLLKYGGLEATEIWLFSFTRTAVHELRCRIASYLDNPADIAALRIATVDSYAWAIHSGFDSEATLTGTFDNNIERVIQLVQNHEGVFSYLSTIGHVIVDEAQDVVGSRCELLLEIINALPEHAGVSIFSDEAQAIYGFVEEGSHAAVNGTLPEKLREFMPDTFSELDLSQVHRTTDATLLGVFQDGRKVIRSNDSSGAERLRSVRQLVEHSNHGALGSYWDDINNLAADQDDTLLLFRRRGEALAASGNRGVQPHRLRMSGLPICIHGWIAVLLWDWIKPEIDADDFARLWEERVGPISDERAKAAWSLLVSSFGRSTSRISVTRLVTKLASGSPTYELALPEFGYAGPIISTIHGSKGREASDVRLYLPTPSSEDSADELLNEEARIVFVGATRARKTLQIGRAESMSVARRLEPSGRAFTAYAFANGKKQAKAAVEIGRMRDVDALGLVGTGLYGSAAEAREAQARVMALKANMSAAQAEATNSSLDWRYTIRAEDGQGHLCFLAKAVNYDLFDIAKFVDQCVRLGKLRPPKQLKHLRCFGTRTLAVAPDDPVRERLHAPWRDSGLIAAPMLMGYSMAYFR